MPLVFRQGSPSVPFYWPMLVPAARLLSLLAESHGKVPTAECHLIVMLCFCRPRKIWLSAAIGCLISLGVEFYLKFDWPPPEQLQVLCIAVYFHVTAIQKLANRFPSTFTAVESVLFCQMMTLSFFSSSLFVQNKKLLNFCSLEINDQTTLAICLLALAGFAIFQIRLFHSKPSQMASVLEIIGPLVVVGGGFVVYQSFLSCNVIDWLYHYVISQNQLSLLTLWVVILGLSILIPYVLIPSLSSANSLPTSIRRKLFHLAILLVMWPGIVYNLGLLRLVSAATLTLLLTAELLKEAKIPPFNQLDVAWKAFTDSKDRGSLTLSHSYLLLGCSLPFLLERSPNPSRLSVYSGLLSIAIGDACAAVIGRTFGTNFWPGAGNRRTLEGSFAFLLSQIIFIVLLLSTGSVDFASSLNTAVVAIFGFAVPIAFVTAVEAMCDHFDNIILPVVTYVAFKSIEYFLHA